MSYLKVPIVARRFTTTAPGPMEVLNIDYLGPLPEDEYGNMYVLNVIDTFSRGIGLYDVPSLEAIRPHSKNVDTACRSLWVS